MTVTQVITAGGVIEGRTDTDVVLWTSSPSEGEPVAVEDRLNPDLPVDEGPG